jgi:hypothetical protein
MSPKFRKAGYVLCISGILGCAHRTARTPEPTLPPPPAPSGAPAPPPVETPPPKAERNPCLLGTEDPVRFERLRVVLVDAVEPAHVPAGVNDSEDLVFRQLYETLVQVDCDGRIWPGLARSWGSREFGRVWVFTLRDSAYFSDGTPVTASQVRDAWLAAREKPMVPGRPGPWSWMRADAVRISGPRQITVRLTSAPPNEAAFFSHPDLAVWKSTGDWPIGSGAYRVTSGSVSWNFSLEPNPDHPFAGRGRSTIDVSVHNASDPRDVLSKADIMLLESKSALSYAKDLGEFQTYPLAWNRTYVLVSPRYSGTRTQSPSWTELRTELSEHIVDADARPATNLSGASQKGCALPRNITSTQAAPRGVIALDPDGGHQLAYPDGDPDAKKLAERLVALAAEPSEEGKVLLGALDPPSSSANPVAVQLVPPAYAASLEAGDRWSYLVSIQRTYTDPCLDAAAFAGSLRWLAARVNAARTRSGSALVVAGIPLLTARNHVALRRGVAGVVQDWDGTLRLAGAGRDGMDAP